MKVNRKWYKNIFIYCSGYKTSIGVGPLYINFNKK